MTSEKSRAVISYGCALSRLRFADRPYSFGFATVGALYERPKRLCVFISLFFWPAFAAAQQYAVHRNAEIVVIEDTKNQVAVSILPSVGNIAFSMKVKGQEVLRWPYASVEEFKSRPAMSGIPFLGPWANRLDEQAFYANGAKYSFDMDLGNVRGAIPIHGFLTTTDQWQVIDANADARSAWLAANLDGYRQPAGMEE